MINVYDVRICLNVKKGGQETDKTGTERYKEMPCKLGLVEFVHAMQDIAGIMEIIARRVTIQNLRTKTPH